MRWRQPVSSEGGVSRSQVGYARINASDAKGIPLARHLAASKFKGQDFFMQVNPPPHPPTPLLPRVAPAASSISP